MLENRISIAMAVYNGGRYIQQQLDSIINQSIRPFEIVICDDQSNDNTGEVIRNYKTDIPIRYIPNEQRLGVVGNFEKAIHLSAGDYIALSDQDDVWYRDKIEVALEKMKDIELPGKPAMVFSDAELVDDQMNSISKSFWSHRGIRPSYRRFEALLFGNAIIGCTILMNRELVKVVGSFPAQATMHDAWLGLIAFGFGTTGEINKPTLKYRQHTTNVTTNDKRTLVSRARQFLSGSDGGDNVFLSEQLAQAREFEKRFFDKLDDRKKKQLRDFIGLERHGLLRRKIASLSKVTLSK